MRCQSDDCCAANSENKRLFSLSPFPSIRLKNDFTSPDTKVWPDPLRKRRRSRPPPALHRSRGPFCSTAFCPRTEKRVKKKTKKQRGVIRDKHPPSSSSAKHPVPERARRPKSACTESASSSSPETLSWSSPGHLPPLCSHHPQPLSRPGLGTCQN